MIERQTLNELFISTHMPLARHDGASIVVLCMLHKFLLTCLLRGMTLALQKLCTMLEISTHMPLARHDSGNYAMWQYTSISTHMPLARHDHKSSNVSLTSVISTHMPLARHDLERLNATPANINFYSHASCEA